jgi:signal transduction histidine kinase
MGFFSDSGFANGPPERAAPLPEQPSFTWLESALGGSAGWSGGAHFESLANLAHELRTPIQVLLGYLDILRDDHCDAGAGDSAENPDQMIIERMNTNVHELAQTVENVLEFALAFAGAEAAIEEEIELAEFFAELHEVLNASNRNENLAVRIDLREAPRKFVTQRRTLRSMVLNLASNAIKFTNDGEVRITVRGCPEDPQMLEIEVRDTGAGISRDLVSSAFEPLVQLSHSSIRRHRGLGLGLAVVQRNVKALNGRLQVESVPGAGTCFKVAVPCSPGVPTFVRSESLA